MGPLAVNTYLTALRRFFGWLEAEKIYPDVTRGVKGCKRPRGFRKDALSPDEARRLLEAMKNKSLLDYAVICLMLYGGLREIEIVRANVEDIGYTEGKHVLRVWGKGRDFADEIIVLVEETHKAILAYLAQRGATSGALFVNYKGQRITTRSIRRIVTAALETVGLKTKRITGHSLRHSAATLALIGGADLLSVKELLRHSSLDTVLCYAHNLNRLKKPAEEAIAKVLSGQ
jgi:site-specific recombinase XerD